jgi:membrane protease YdiL (CAAX protease family)
MQIYKTQAPIASKRLWFLSLLVTVLVTIGTMLVLQGIGLVLIPPIFDISLDELVELMIAPSQNSEGKMAIYFLQGLSSGIAFIVSAWIIIKGIDKADIGWKQQKARFQFKGLFILIGVMLGGIFFNALIIDWNANVTFPESWSIIESYLQNAEEQRMVMTKFLTDFASVNEFLVGLIVIGVLAGIGEEVFFRGVVQPKMQIYTGNPHIAVWLTAFVFSAIHVQFYGLFPRMFLGAVFGYLYLYSGSLIYPIIAHILNNSLTVVLVYLDKLGMIEFEIEKTDQVSWPIALLGLVFLLISLKFFKEKHSYFDGHEKLEESI